MLEQPLAEALVGLVQGKAASRSGGALGAALAPTLAARRGVLQLLLRASGGVEAVSAKRLGGAVDTLGRGGGEGSVLLVDAFDSFF